jgi:2-oxoglutarate dehydrogenase complex dihydrolipoamide succinyltransferase (E2) component
LPDLGEGVAEGEIVKWLVHEGDSIREDQPMVEVMTDKATVQIPSPTTGKVSQIMAKEGQTVKVGTTLVTLEEAGGNGQGAGRVAQSPPSTQTVQQSSQKQTIMPQPQPVAGQPRMQVVATPATRKLARELDVELESVVGSGPGGRITEEDVRGAAKSPAARQKLVQPQQTVTQQPQVAKTELGMPSRSAVTATSKVAFVGREERIPIHGIRKRIAEKMSKSAHTTAAVTHVDEVDFSQLVALKEKAKPAFESQNVKLTFMPFIMKAAVAALKEFPYFNASMDDEKQEIVLKHYYNIGVATDTENGLIVPVIKDADKKSLLDIARELSELSAKARDGKIALEEIQGGTFTITNIGTLGGILSTPIINTPEVAILGVHKIQKRPVVREGEIVIRDIANVALSFDHRIVDGADAARFTTKLISFLENPGLLLIPEAMS